MAFVLSILSSLIATGIVAVFSYFIVRKSLYSKIDTVLSANSSLKQADEALSLSKQVLQQMSSKITGIEPTEFDKKSKQEVFDTLQDIRNSVDTAHAIFGRMQGGLQVLEKLGKDVK